MASNVSSLSPSSPLQITGLASGLDTNSIIQELMAIQSKPLTNITNQQKGEQALNSNLGTVQSALQGLVGNAQALSSASLFSNTQTVSSTNSAVVSASANANVGAVVGGYQIAVSQMATASQQSFAFASQSSANMVTVNHTVANSDGSHTIVPKSYNLAAGASAQDLVNSVNADSTGTVWGTVVNGNIVFSDRTTGSNSSFTVSDGAGALSAQGAATPGQDAQYTVNGGSPQSSHSNTVTGAIPGVTLNLSGVTTGSTPVTVNVGAPNISTSAIQTAVQTFVGAYNSVLTQLGSQLTQKPSTSDPTVGTLYGDPELTDLLTNMRQAMYSGGSGLPTGMASMLDIGVSTGASTGSSTPSQNAISGQLALNTDKLTQAIQSNPSGVTAMLKSWSQSFTNLVNAVAEPGGTISSRVSGNSAQINNLSTQISTMQAALADRQNQLTQQFAALEAALSQSQSQASWLTSQINSLTPVK